MRVRGIILICILLASSVGIAQSTSYILSANQASELSESLSESNINSKVEELISDPLNYSTFIGGSGDDRVETMALDSFGNTYVAGRTSSPDFPIVNAFNSTYGGGYSDCFVQKLSADGSDLLFSTFIGGQDYEFAKSIVVDEYGNAYVTGVTNSTDFPTVNA